MKKSWIIIIIIVILGFITYSWFKGTYNNMVTLSETVDKQWADVENVYQRRADLIPNLVATVKGYASHEKETLEGVINARAKATSTTINAGDLTPGKIAAFLPVKLSIKFTSVMWYRYGILKFCQSLSRTQSVSQPPSTGR